MKTFYKTITWILLLTFLSQNIVWSTPTHELLTINYKPLTAFYIPEQYGKIEKSMDCGPWTMDSKQPKVVLIKDAHCNYEAQTNISKILDILIRDYKIDLIGAEGASGYVNPSIVLESNPKEDIRKKVSDKFLRTGLLTASEALSINKGKDPGFTIWGIEDLKLYLRDFQAFRDSVGINNSAKHFIELLFNLTGQLKKKIYPEELLEFDDIIRKYQLNELPLTRFIKILYYKYSIPKQHQNLKLVLKSMRLEEKIDFKKVEYERGQLIRQLEKTLPKEDLQELVKQSLLFKLGKIPAEEYYTYLNGQTINLKNYTRLVKLQSRIDESALFNELDDITEKIYAKLCRDKISHNLHLLDKDINILNKILSLEATREALTYFKENYARFTPENLLRFIRIQAPLNNINLPPEISSPSFIEDAEKAIIPAEEFYRLAIERDNALVENLVQTMDKNKKDKAVLICGGFHADGIKKLLQDKGISPITITPSITKIQEDSKELYLKRMMDERMDPEKLLKELGTENVSPTLATSRTGIEIKLNEEIIASFKSYGYEIKQEFTQEEFRKLLPLLKELHNKALEDKNESLRVFIENAVKQSGLEQEFQKLGGDSQEGNPKIFDPKFVRFTPQNLVLRLSNILGNSKELHRLRHVIPKLIEAKEDIKDTEESSDIARGMAYPYNCQRCAKRTVEILERYGFLASIVDIKFSEENSDKISHHAFVTTKINGKDVIVDIAADEFEPVEGKENEFLDLGVVILPLDDVKSDLNLKRFWMYNPPVTQRSAEPTAQKQQPDKQGGSGSGNDTLHMESMKLRKGSKYYADRLQINSQDVDINGIKEQISRITNWMPAPGLEEDADEKGFTVVGDATIEVKGKSIRIYKLTSRGKNFYITSKIITGFGSENFLKIIDNALSTLQGEGKNLTALPNDIYIFNLSGSPHLFEDHTRNGFIGINEALVDLYTNPSTTDQQKQSLSSLLQIGLEHKLLHEMGITDESFIARRDAKRIVEELYTKKGDIEKIKRLIALLEGDVEIEPDFKVELIIALIKRHNRGRPIPNLRKNLNESFNNDKTLKDYLLSFFENGFLLTIDLDDLRKRYIAIEDIRMPLDLLLKTARELPPWWVKRKDIVPLIIKFIQVEKPGTQGETRMKEEDHAETPEDITVDCLSDNTARIFLHELAHYRWCQMEKPGIFKLQKNHLYPLLAVPDAPVEELIDELIAEVAATGGITSFLKRYGHLLLSGLMSQRDSFKSFKRSELFDAVRLILITHLFRNPEPHPRYTNLHEYTWPYVTDSGSIEVEKGWVRHNGEENWEEVIDERFLSTLKAPGGRNDAIKKGRVPHKTVNRQIRKAILEGRAYKVWNRAGYKLEGDREISVNTKEEKYIEQCKEFLLPEFPEYLDKVDIVIIKDKDFLYFRNDNNHQSAHAGHRRRTCYLGEGLYNKIKNNPQTLAAALAHEIFHIEKPKRNENEAEAIEIRIDPERNLRRAINELLSEGIPKEEKLKKFFSTGLPDFFMQVHFGSDNPQPLIDGIITEASKIDEQFATYIGRIAPLIARGSHNESRYEAERLCGELNDEYLLARGFYIYVFNFMLNSEHYLKIRFYRLYKRTYSDSDSLPSQLSVLQDRVYLMERLDSLEQLYSQSYFNFSTYLHQIGRGTIPSDELQNIADDALRIRRGGEYFTDSHYDRLGNLQTELLRKDTGLEDISNIQREIENSFAIGECHLLQGLNEIPYSLRLPYNDLLFIARVAFGNVPFIEISRMLQCEKECNRVSASNNFEPLSATYSFFLLARKLGFTHKKGQIRDWDVLRQVVEGILDLPTGELQRIAREIYEEELPAIKAQIPQAPTRTTPPSSATPPQSGTRAVTIAMRGNVLEELPAPEGETGIPQHIVPFIERAERGVTEREPAETSTSPETPGVRYEYIYNYTKANRGEEYYLNQIRQARVQLERTTDIEERISIFLAVIWPQYLMALDDDSCGVLIEEQVIETARILDAEFGRQIARIIPLARELNNPTTAARAKEQIKEIAAALRSNRFLIGHRFFLDTEVLERTNLQTHQTVWTLSSISYPIDSTNTYQVRFRGRNSALIKIHFLGERVDRLNQQRAALGYTFLGDTFGVVVKKVVRDVVNMDIIPILNGVPFTDAQVHPINESARRAVLRDGLPAHPNQTQLADIYERFYRSTEIHELDHKIVECAERLAHLRNNPFEQRIRMEASAYLASIIDGPVPYTDLITILRLILGFRLALFDPYKPAGVLIFTEFARELGIEVAEEDIGNGRLDSLNNILTALIKLKPADLKKRASKVRENILNRPGQTIPIVTAVPVSATPTEPGEIPIVTAEPIPATTGKLIEIKDIILQMFLQMLPFRLTKFHIILIPLIFILTILIYAGIIPIRTFVHETPQPPHIEKPTTPPPQKPKEYPLYLGLDIEKPRYTKSYKEHTVETGESYSSLAQKFFGDYRLWPLIWYENGSPRNPDILRKGPVKIPVYELPSGSEYPIDVTIPYTVKPGDTLKEISERFYKKPIRRTTILTDNPDIENPHRIKPGRVINLKFCIPRSGHTLKAPGSKGLDKQGGSDSMDEDRGEKEYIESIIRKIPDETETRQYEETEVIIHKLDLGDKLGIPRFEGATSPQDLVYALGSNGKIIGFDKATNEFTTETDGKLHIYVTTAFWEMLQKKENQLMLDFLLDHEYQEKILGKTHAEASQRAWFFVDKYRMNPFYKFFIDQLAEAKDIDYLRKLLAKHPNDPGGRFRDYVLETLAIKIPYRLQKELDEKINTEDFNDLLPTLLKLREIHPVIEGLLTENGMLSTLVFEKLENILFDILRVGNVSAKVNLMCITLPMALLNPLGYEVANDVKEKFYEKIKGYIAEKKPAEQEERGIRQAYAQLSGQYYGFSKTRLFVVGLNEEDFKDIKRLFKESLEEAEITNPEDYPVYAGHMHVSLRQGLLSLIGTRIAQIIYKILNTQFMQKLFNNLSPFIPKYFVTLGANIKSSLYRLAKIGNLKGKIHGKFEKDNKEVSIAIEEIIVDAIKEVTGRAEIAEKVLKQNILGSGHKISLFRHRDAIDRGRDKFIPENEYDTGRIPRLSHEMGYLDRLYIGFEVGLGGYFEDEINIDEVMERYKEYKNILNKYILQSLQDTRYRKAYKKNSAGAVIMAWRDGTLKEYIDYLNTNGLEDIAKKWASPLKMTKMGDEIWLYLQKENGEIIQVFVELDKFNAFNEQYPPDARDSFYHQILESIFTHYDRVNGQLKPFIEVLEDAILDTPIKIPDDEVYRNGYMPMSKSVEIDWYEKGRTVEIKSVPVLSKQIKNGEWIKLRKLEFHHTEKIKGQRAPVFVARKTGNPERRVVVYERRIYTDDGKEDITDEILGNGWEISPYIGPTGAAIMPDSHSLTNLDPDKHGNLGTYQKKKLRQTYKEPMDALDTIAHQIMSILEKHKIEISDEDKRNLMGDIKRQLIRAYKEKIKIDFMELWKLIEGRIEPKKFFEIAVDISEPLNALLGPEARVRGMHMMNAVLELVLEELPKKERKEISEDKRLTTEKKILEAMKRIGAKKGIDPNAIQSIFDLFKAGVNILTIDPGLDIGKIDGSYFAMIHELEKLIKQETGISEGAIRNAFKKEFGIDAKITDGQIIEGSILWKEVQRLIEYNKSDEGDYNIANINTNLWHSDFHIGTVIDKANNKRNRYLSALDVVGKDTKSIINLLRGTPVRNSLESKTKVGIIYHIMNYITIHDRGKGTFGFSYRPGIETIFRQMEEGINIVFTTEGIPEEDLQYYEAALKATGRLDKNIFIEESPAGANNRLRNIGINTENIVYVANTEEKAKRAKDLGLKSIITTKDSSFHASLIFAILYARAKTDEINTLIWRFLDLMGYKDEEIREVISDLKKHGFFTVRLIRIADTLKEFQNRKIFIDVAA